MATIVDFLDVFGHTRAVLDELRAVSVVTWAWREHHVLAEAEIEADGDIVDIEDVQVRSALELQHAQLLKDRGIPHLDLNQVRSKDRIVTQTISRGLFDDGAAGIHFRSNLDSGDCYALFEGRAELVDTGQTPEPFTDDLTELLQVAGEFRLVLQHGPV